MQKKAWLLYNYSIARLEDFWTSKFCLPRVDANNEHENWQVTNNSILEANQEFLGEFTSQLKRQRRLRYTSFPFITKSVNNLHTRILLSENFDKTARLLDSNIRTLISSGKRITQSLDYLSQQHNPIYDEIVREFVGIEQREEIPWIGWEGPRAGAMRKTRIREKKQLLALVGSYEEKARGYVESIRLELESMMGEMETLQQRVATSFLSVDTRTNSSTEIPLERQLEVVEQAVASMLEKRVRRTRRACPTGAPIDRRAKNETRSYQDIFTPTRTVETWTAARASSTLESWLHPGTVGVAFISRPLHRMDALKQLREHLRWMGSTIVSLPERPHMPFFGFREDGRTCHYLPSRCAYVSLFCPRPSSANDSTFPNMQILLHHAVYTPPPLKTTCQKNALYILLRDICLDQHKFPLPICYLSITIATPIHLVRTILSIYVSLWQRIKMLMIAHHRRTWTWNIYIYMLVGCGEKGIGILYIVRKLANFKSHFPYHYSTKRGT